MRKKHVCSLSKNSCSVTNLNLYLHCGNLLLIGLSLNFYPFIPSLSSPSFPKGPTSWLCNVWFTVKISPLCSPDKGSSQFLWPSMEESPPCINKPAHQSLYTNENLQPEYLVLSQQYIRKQFIFGLWTSASTSDSVLLISILFHWKQLYIPRHKNRINNPKKKSPHIQAQN